MSCTLVLLSWLHAHIYSCPCCQAGWDLAGSTCNAYNHTEYYAFLLLSRLVARTDSVFRARYNPLKSAALGLYDLHFQKQWQKRWHYLLVDQQLYIQDIGRHDVVVQISLRDTLGPRWAFLMSIATSVASFRPVDHLTALSTIGDSEYIQLAS